MRMERDGQDRKTVYLPADTYVALGSGTVTANDEMLIVLLQVHEDTSESSYIASVNFSTGSIEHQYEFAGEESPFLIGECAKGPIIAINDHIKSSSSFILTMRKNISWSKFPLMRMRSRMFWMRMEG